MCVSKQVHSTVPGQYSTCPGTAVGTKQHLCSEQSPGLGRSWHRHGRVVARQVGEGGRRRENASCGGTDAERAVLLLVEWEEQEREEQHKRKRVRIDGVPWLSVRRLEGVATTASAPPPLLRTSYTSPSGACSQCFRRS